MSNIAFLWDSQHRSAAWAASSAKSTLPASNLGTDEMGAEWQTAEGVDEAYVVADVGSDLPVSVMALLNLACSSAASFTFKVSNSDPTGLAGEVYSSLPFYQFDPTWRHLVHVLPSQVMGRYRRIEISDPGAARIAAACMPQGAFWQPAHNVEYGVALGFEDDDQRTYTRGGVEYIDAAAQRRVLRARLPALTAEDHSDQLMPMARHAARRRPILAILNPAATVFGFNSIWGRIRSPLEFPAAFHAHYAWSFEISETL